MQAITLYTLVDDIYYSAVNMKFEKVMAVFVNKIGVLAIVRN